ncbi:SPOR domain-containing protein [Chlorobaculum tepidum]|nr:SPOR domain-containing protein [Chlorobaculum tepidum]
MAAQTAADILARLLGIGPDEAQHQLDRFAGGMTAELLDRKRLAVGGLGVFSVVHEQATRQTTASGTRYQPPRDRVAFEARKELTGDAERIASVRLGMEASEARRLAKALGELFEAMKKGTGRFELRGFGSFTLVSGALRFQPESSLEALLNIGYGDLKEVVIADHSAEKETLPAPEKPGGLKKAALFVAAVLMLASGWFLYRQFAPDGVDALPSAGSSAESGVAAPVASSALSAPLSSKAPESVQASPDSLILQKGRYTVIVATFNTRKVVRQEIARLSEMGHRVWCWPVTSGGSRYYRLVIGDFETRKAALDSMKSMPKGLSSHSYIQQAPKNVVLYGEQGL